MAARTPRSAINSETGTGSERLAALSFPDVSLCVTFKGPDSALTEAKGGSFEWRVAFRERSIFPRLGHSGKRKQKVQEDPCRSVRGIVSPAYQGDMDDMGLRWGSG